MRKLVLPALIAASSLSAVASAENRIVPYSPMTDYRATNVSTNTMKRLWRYMHEDVKGKDCYKRAHIWSYDMYRSDNIYSKKAFIHYTDKFNRLDQGDGHLSWIARKTNKVFKSNTTWDYHVAPMIVVEGENVVMDRHLYKKPLKLEVWVQKLANRGSTLANELRRILLKKLKKTKNEKKIAKINKTFRELGISKNPSVPLKITCKKIDHIMQFDLAQSDAWCFYSEAPMYYWNQVNLRNLNIGDEVNARYNIPIQDISVYTQENFMKGRDHIMTHFDEDQLKMSLKEMKGRSELNEY